MFPISFKGGHVIIKQGAPPDNFYILNSGDCRVLKRTGDEEKQVALLHPGQYFGELALISGRARAATVVSGGDVTCWAIDQTTYLGLLKEHHVQKRQRYQSLLRSVPALSALPDYEILLVADALQPVDPPDGEAIIKQGDSGDEFFIILEGECRVMKKEDGAQEAQQVALLGSGQYFGELALMRDSPRAATVVAGPQCKLIKLDRASFHRLLGPCYQLFQENMKSYDTTA
jgi:cAMP-dependent protein kinase regulator